ncbi:MAG: cytochrome C [Chloroflexi bacterium]|nr:MAG: cytochrome C [Chloroflexota bacterium]
MKRYVLLSFTGLVILAVFGFIVIQFIPVARYNPAVHTEPPWDSPQTKMLVERACYDCHSNRTQWPWYSYIAPFSWLVAHDVNEGRAALNFSLWNQPGGGELMEEEAFEHEGNEGAEELIEVVREGEMPPPYYLWTHPQARLTPQETQALIQGLQATFGRANLSRVSQ